MSPDLTFQETLVTKRSCWFWDNIFGTQQCTASTPLNNCNPRPEVVRREFVIQPPVYPILTHFRVASSSSKEEMVINYSPLRQRHRGLLWLRRRLRQGRRAETLCNFAATNVQIMRQDTPFIHSSTKWLLFVQSLSSPDDDAMVDMHNNKRSLMCVCSHHFRFDSKQDNGSSISSGNHPVVRDSVVTNRTNLSTFPSQLFFYSDHLRLISCEGGIWSASITTISSASLGFQETPDQRLEADDND